MFSLMGTIWFLIILFGGAILFAICKGRIEGKGFKRFSIEVGVIATIVGICFLLSGNTLVGGIIISVVLLITIICCVIGSKYKKEAEETQRANEIKRKEEEKKRNLRKFYEQCKEAGIDKLETESQKQRAILYAKELGLDENDVAALIKGEIESIKAEKDAEKARVEKEKSDKIEKQKSDKYKRDAAEQQKLKTPYPYFGQEKRIAVWQEKLDEVNKVIAGLEQEIKRWSDAIDYASSSKHVNTVIQSKVDPYIAGGIGSAIGGAGAGMMAALDAQKENEKIEYENEKNVKRLFESVTNFLILKQQKEAERSKHLKFRWEYEDKIKEIKLKLVDEIKIENPMDLLEIHDVKVTQNKFKIDLSLKNDTLIFGDVNAVIDGAFWAHIYQDKEYIGSVRVILPYDGVDTKTSKISVDTSLGINPKKECYIEYEAEKLWFIER